ncbi:MAG: hydroxyethylthiazole kinase [Clostridiales bacterium]|nr:hydroxyethylthiazole kinase [Clostridiales bacterium]
MLQHPMERLRRQAPLVHCITNYVTVNDVANMLLACGASPVMADAPEEAGTFSGSGCLYLNLGTLNRRTVDAMYLAGRANAERGRPILLDPVGVGATDFRMQTARALLRDLPIAAVRGNASEIRALADMGGQVGGVDASAADAVTDETVGRAAAFACALSARLGTVVSFSGPIDIIADRGAAYAVRNGVARMPRITGSGCMLSGVVAALIAAHPEQVLEATVTAYAAMGLCGEIAEAALREGEGTGSFRARMIDAMSLLDDAQLERGRRVQRVI